MKIVTFRPSGFADNPLVGIGAAEVSDLTAETLGRLVVDMRHRITIRETLATAERLWWSTSVSMACWTAVLTMAVEELHSRALTEHVAWCTRRLAAKVPGSAADAARMVLARRAAREDPQIGHYAHAAIEALARNEDLKLSVYGGPAVTSLVDDSQADNALATERCEAAGRTKLMNTPVRCQGVTGHVGQHFSGPRAARTWWA